MTDQDLWTLEETLWTGGVDAYRLSMAPACVMAFGPPVGVLSGAAILQSLEQAPRWRSVRMDERTVGRPAPDLTVLAYRATADRGDDPYVAWCTSTWRRDGDRWLLVQHQQTPG